VEYSAGRLARAFLEGNFEKPGQRAFESHGLPDLRATRLQQYA